MNTGVETFANSHLFLPTYGTHQDEEEPRNYKYLPREIYTDDYLVHKPDLMTWAENLVATDEIKRPEIIDKSLEIICFNALDEYFEDGIKSHFVDNLISLIEFFGNYAIDAFSDLISKNQINPEVISEGLRWLGHMDQIPTHRARLSLLVRCLSSSSSRIRDGASLGLAFLDDPSAVPYLRKSAEKEIIPELKDDIFRVINQFDDNNK